MYNHLDESVAIVGMAGRFPGAADLAALLEILRSGECKVEELPVSRRMLSNLTAGRFQVQASLEDIDCFDFEFFGISLGESQYIDPHQRLLLETAYHAIENSGYANDELKGANVGVFLASTDQNYHMLSRAFDPMFFTGTMDAIGHGRISRFFDFRGVSMSIDTACSSSLVAIHIACRELLTGEVDAALVAAAKIILFPKEKGSEEGSGILSGKGLSRSFSADADGTGLGEGVGALFLKRTRDAIKDDDLIHAIIRGSATNQDAQQSSSLTAPSSMAQADVIKKAWRKASVDPDTIGYIEAHGTGTRLGDPIEVEGISKAFGDHTGRKQFCALGSVKSNFGHLDSAAGMSGIIKAVLSIKSSSIFPSVNFTEPNPLIDFIDSPVYVNIVLRKWDEAVRRAGVSSFGISGTNSHIVLESAPAKQPTCRSTTGPSIFAVSGHTRDALLRNLRNILHWLENNVDVDVETLSATLLRHRKHFPFRWATIAGSYEDLVRQVTRAVNEKAVGDTVQSEREFWFTFSGNADVSENELTALSQQLPALKSYITRCMDEGFVPHRHAGPIFQYAAYSFLKTLGIAPGRSVGSGYGRQIIQVIKEAVTLNAILPEIENQPEKRDFGQLYRFLQSKSGRADVDFCEVGRRGDIGHYLNMLQDEFKSIGVSEIAPTREGFANIIVKWYLSGKNVNWENWIPVRDRLDLPPYAFEKSRAWLPLTNTANQFFQVMWKRHDLEGVIALAETPRCVVVWMDENDPIGLELTRGLEHRGARCIQVHLGSSLTAASQNRYVIGGSEEEFKELRRKLDAPPAMHIYCGYSNASTLGESEIDRLLTFPILIWKAFEMQTEDVSFVSITRNGQFVLPGDTSDSPMQSTPHGLFASLAKECPGKKLKCIDVDPNDPHDLICKTILAEVFSANDMISVAYRGNERYVRAMIPFVDDLLAAKTVLAKGVYVVTGGMSGLGLEVAKFLSTFHNADVVVVGRSEPGEPMRALSAGTGIEYFQCDVGNSYQVMLLRDHIRSLGPLKGIVHAAGIGGDRRAHRHSPETFRSALLPKILGAINLIEVLDINELDFFIMFSSHDALTGVDRGTNYSAANVFLDSYAVTLRNKGIPACSIQWGFWAETGMGFRMHQFDENKRDPRSMITNSEGIEFFSRIVSALPVHVLVSKLDPSWAGKNRNFLTGTPDAVRRRSPQDKINIPAYDPAWTQQENEIAFIWRDVLKVERLKLSDNFFHLGGHSLIGIRVRNFLEKNLGYDIEFTDLIRYPTISELGAWLAKQRKTGTTRRLIPKSTRQEHYAMSHAQRRIWIAHQLDQSGIAHIVRDAFEKFDHVDETLAENAFRLLVAAHDSLRTTFPLIAGLPRQRIVPAIEQPSSFKFVDLTGINHGMTKVKEAVEREIKYPFDMENGPLIRALLFRLAPEHHVIVLLMHHIIVDAWSLDLIWKELMENYQSLEQGAEIKARDGSFSYTDYSEYHNNRVTDEASEEAVKFWKKYLEAFPAQADLPLDKPRPLEINFDGSRYHTAIDRKISDSIRAFCSQRATTPFVVFAAACAQTLHAYSGATDIVVGTIASGRDELQLEDQIGYFLNMVPIRVSTDERRSGDELVRHTHDQVLKAFEYQWYPFDLVLKHVNYEPVPGRNPLFDVVINMNKTESGADSRQGWRKVVVDTSIVHSKFDLILYIDDAPEFQVMIEYKTDLMTRATIEKFFDIFKKTLKAIVHEPETPVGSKLSKDAETMSIKRIVRSQTQSS